MGLAERIPLQLPPDLDLAAPFQLSTTSNASQPPLGCRWYSPGAVSTLVAGVATLIPFRGTTAQFDPYNMISTADNSVTIPQPGIWDIHFEIRVGGVAGQTNVYAQFNQSLTPAVNDGIELCAGHPGMAAGSQTLRIDTPTYITRATLGAGVKYAISGLCLGANTDFQLITFAAWLRSAFIPSKY